MHTYDVSRKMMYNDICTHINYVFCTMMYNVHIYYYIRTMSDIYVYKNTYVLEIHSIYMLQNICIQTQRKPPNE